MLEDRADSQGWSLLLLQVWRVRWRRRSNSSFAVNMSVSYFFLPSLRTMRSSAYFTPLPLNGSGGALTEFQRQTDQAIVCQPR